MVPAIFGAWAPVLADFVEVAPGERALDVACGTGIVARELVGRVGANGTVVGCDSNAVMLATAREVAPEIDWKEGNALDLPFEAASFDVVTCQQGYQFFPDRVKAAQEAHRVLVGDGRLALAVWLSLSDNPGQAAVVSAVQEHVSTDAAKIVGSAFGLGEDAQLQEFLTKAGFQELRSITQTHPARFPSVFDFAVGLLRGGTLARAGVELSDDTMARIAEHVSASLGQYQDGNELVFPMSSNLVLAKKPRDSERRLWGN
jgi:ubiquinone/menaquinone biosynthesis C-methylase UbiE